MPDQVRRLESECYSLLQTVATDKVLRGLDAFSAPIMLCDMAARGWPILHANEAWVKRLGGCPARSASWRDTPSACPCARCAWAMSMQPAPLPAPLGGGLP